jgi:hypothetical protein
MDVADISKRVREIRNKKYSRDQRMENVRAVRAGDVSHVVPGMLPDAWPKSTVSNIIDIAARVVAESAGTMPSILCTSGVNVSDRQKKYAQKRTLIAQHYSQASKLKTNMVQAADLFETFGFIPFIVEPCFDEKDIFGVGPRIRIEHPMYCYYDLTPWGRVKTFFKVFDQEVGDLINKFPEVRGKLLAGDNVNMSTRLEVIWWMDDEQILLFCPQRNNLVLSTMSNRLGRCPVFIAERGRFDDETRGAFDDVTWIQLLRMRISMLSLRVMEQSVNAPMAGPMDVTKFAWGPNQMIRSNDADKIRRVGLEVSPVAMQLPEMLQQEIFTAARFPEGATGKPQGSVVTGAGMDSMMSTMDSRVKTSQLMLGEKLQEALNCCFEMDEKFWPGTIRKVRVNVNGTLFEDTYKPRKDIAGIYEVDVTYGMLAGMDTNRAMVFMLQGRGDNLFSREFVLQNMPFDINPQQVQQQVHVEQAEDGLKQAIIGALGAAGQMAAQGQDPTQMITAGALFIQEIERGTSVADAAKKAFAQPAAPPAAPGQEQGPPGQAGPPGAPSGAGGGLAALLGGGAPPGGGQPPGGPPGASPMAGPPGQAPGQPAGGSSIEQLLAGLTGGGGPTMGASVKKKIPTG